MAKEQKSDPEINPILIPLLQGKGRPLLQEISQHGPITRTLWHQYSSLTIVQKVLYRKFEHPSGNPELTTLQLILPRNFIEPTVQFYHGTVSCAQHYGREKTMALLKRYFYWPFMADSVAQVIDRCEICFKAKGPTHRVKPPLKLFKDGLLHGRWHVDFCGPFVQTKEGYRYILVAVESFSCWPVAVPTKTQKSIEVAQNLIDHVFSVYGAPNSIKTDQGRQFEAQLLNDVMKLYGIERSHTTPFHPQANGKVEVFIRTLKEHLRMLVQTNQKDWPKHLSLICQVYRALPVSSTSYSPYEILFGFPMRLPIDLVRGKPPQESSSHQAQKAYAEYPLVLRQQLWKLHEEVRHNIQKAARQMKENYDKTANYTPFEVGQKVWLFTPTRAKGLSPKLQMDRWTGPWVILHILNDCVARIQLLENLKKIQIVNVERLAPFLG